MLLAIWRYYHQHLQDNVNASGVWAVLGFAAGRKSVHGIRQHLRAQDAKTRLIHKHIKEIHKKVNQ